MPFSKNPHFVVACVVVVGFGVVVVCFAAAVVALGGPTAGGCVVFAGAVTDAVAVAVIVIVLAEGEGEGVELDDANGGAGVVGTGKDAGGAIEEGTGGRSASTLSQRGSPRARGWIGPEREASQRAKDVVVMQRN